MNDDHPKQKPVGNFPNEEAGRADAIANAKAKAMDDAERIGRERKAALARCLASPDDVPTPEDVDRVRHLYIRLDRRVDGQHLLSAGRRETWEAIRGLLVRWETMGAGNVDSILNSRGGGEFDTWKAIQAWADKEHLRPVKDAGGDGQTFASPAQLAGMFGRNSESVRKRLDRWRKKHAADGGGDWIENTEAGSRSPRYLYRVSAVQDIVKDAPSA